MFFCTIIQLYYCTFDIERSRAYASPALFRRLAQGSLPTWAGSPLVGRDLHPLDDTQSFMKASPPPIPFDQQSLVTLNVLYACRLIYNQMLAHRKEAWEQRQELLRCMKPTH